MRRIFCGIFVIGSLAAVAFAQSGDNLSLGDIARVNRDKQQAEQASGTKPRMITNQDLPASASAGIPEENPADPMTQVSGVHRNFRTYAGGYRGYQNGGQRYGGSWGQRPFGQPSMHGEYAGGQYAGDQLRGQIRTQEDHIAQLQSRIDRASASMHPYGSTAQFEGPLNRYQAVQAQRIEMMQQMLDQQRQRLAMLQDEARHQGMHTQAYEP